MTAMTMNQKRHHKKYALVGWRSERRTGIQDENMTGHRGKYFFEPQKTNADGNINAV